MTCITKDSVKWIDPETINLDAENPRIQPFIAERNPEELTSDDISLALSGGRTTDAISNVKVLRTAITMNQGIMQPIIVNKKNDEMVAIDGNTRLKIYQEFKKKNPNSETWKTIPCVVFNNLPKDKVDALRLQSHLIGAKEWKAYAKGMYLYKLTHTTDVNERMDTEQLASFCGGRQTEVKNNIGAYADMVKYYKKRYPDKWKPEYFSAFLILQQKKIRLALQERGLSKEDYADWIAEGKIHNIAHLRKLDKIVESDDVFDKFIRLGSEHAILALGHPKEDEALVTVKVEKLIDVLNEKLETLQIREIKELVKKESALDVLLTDLKENIQTLEENITWQKK